MIFNFEPSLTKREKIVLPIVGLVASVGLYYGWRLFWFLTDDAFIAFRYVSNSILGYGYVWNAPPFRPVEGYTSFLWMVILDVVWRVFNIEPPRAANWLALGFSFATLMLASLMVISMQWSESLKRYRVLFLALILLGTLTNRTFLAWTSSGLETSLFNFTITLWCYSCLFISKSGKLWVFAVSASALLVYLTRPDGMLFSLASLIILGCGLWIRGRNTRFLDITFALPLLGIPLHFLWRHSVYGEWLPNTYYAKVIAGRIWWESGYRYVLSFVIEYSLWFWIVLFLIWFIYFLNDHRLSKDSLHMPAGETVIQILVILSVVAHFLYYTIVVGGDHFEFRVYSHLILFLFITYVWFLNKARIRHIYSVGLLMSFIFFSWPIPWAQWQITHEITNVDIAQLEAPVAKYFLKTLPSLPRPVVTYLEAYDNMQFWLAGHLVCVRHQGHKIFAEFLLRQFISREEGTLIAGENYPVAKRSAVGVISWILPNVNIIDQMGLNDYVTARNPELRVQMQMAHERKPPPGYVECFSPNVVMKYKKVVINQRAKPLTATDIVNCEAKYRQWISEHTP